MVRALAAAVFAIGLTILSTLLTAPAVSAAPLPLPEPRPAIRVVEQYPDQMPPAGIGAAYSPGAPGFLTLPYLRNGHFISSTFDHCNPDYGNDGVICRFDGTVAYAGNGADPSAPTGYSMTPGKEDYLYYDGHDGVDFGLYYEPVVAAADGIVTYADWSTPGCTKCSFGRGVRIDHRNGFDTLYGHLWRIDVTAGQRVSRGQVLGISGTTGASTGEHLHFGVYHHSTWDPVDPFGWSGPGPDPWAHDAGNLWVGGTAKSPAVELPTLLAKAAVAPSSESGTDIVVDWASPGAGLTFDVTQFTDDAAGVHLMRGTRETRVTVHGERGHEYWFLVTASSPLGHGDSAVTAPVALIPDRAAIR